MKSYQILACLVSLCPLLNAADPAPAKTSPKDDPKYTWDLSLIYKDEAAYTAAKTELAAKIPSIKACKGHLGDSPAKLRESMDLVYSLYKEYNRLASYASQKQDENLKDADATERSQEMDMLGSEFSQAAAFINPEVIALGKAKIEAFLAADPALAPYRFPLEEILRAAPHTLGDEAEGVLSATGMVTDAPSSLYGILTSADITWPKIKLSDGSEAYLDNAGYTRYRSHNNRADREAVFRAFWAKYKEYERTLGVALFSQVKADSFRATVRKYPNSLAAALSTDDVPESVYRTLLSETNANLPTLHRYFRLRGKLLGVSELHYWDMYPSIVKSEKSFPYDEAKGIIIEATRPLGADYTKLITECLNGRYTHVYPKPGKRSGAYNNGSVYDVHAFSLLNYNDDYESLTTTAHEWGHGGHSQLSNHNQPFPTSQYSIFTAEIASTLNEALLLEHMLKIARNDDEKLFYLGSALEGLRTTFFRQAMFAEYELAIHEEVEKGGALSGQKLTKIYSGILRRYHGDAEGVVKIDDLVTLEWAYIPHFYRNFYVFQYATSLAASQAFAQRILQGEAGAVDTYLGVLKAGGSDHPYNIVKNAGVDLATPAPYRALVARMNSIMDRIEALLAAKQK